MPDRWVGVSGPKLGEVTGETDLAKMLSTLSVQRRDGAVTLVSIEGPIELGNGIEALMMESEGTTVVATLDEAERRGWPIDFEAAWLTVEVHSSLESVGLTAVMSRALSERGIPCNVLAGYYHDHLLVPMGRAEEAVEALEALRD